MLWFWACEDEVPEVWRTRSMLAMEENIPITDSRKSEPVIELLEPWTLWVWLPPTLLVLFLPMEVLLLLPMAAMRSLFTCSVRFFWARMWTSSRPAASSNMISLYPPFDGVELLFHPLWVLFSGS